MEVPFHTLIDCNFGQAGGNGSLYQGLRYIEVR